MLQFSQLTVSKRLCAVSGEANAGQFVHVLGMNGSGKSSLLLTLAGLLSPDSGHIRLLEQSISDYSLPQLARIRCLQEQQQSTAFALSVAEILQFYSGLAAIPELLEQALEVNAFWTRQINHLSGGEARRVHIARCLMQVWPAIEQGKALVLLDEPNQGLDFKHQLLLFHLLKRIAGKGNVVIVNHHELNLAEQFADRIWLMQDGRMVAQADALDRISYQTLSGIFGCQIRSAWDDEGNKIFQTFLEPDRL